MWPWEHLAFGYVLFSFWLRVRTRELPSDAAVVAVALGTQLPDLIDKPGAWVFGVLPSGISLAHSLFVAVPLAVLAIGLGGRLGHRQVGTGFAIGYLSHLVGDVLWSLAVGGTVPTILWPLVPANPDNAPFFDRLGELSARFLEFLATPNGLIYLGVEIAFLAGAVALWRRDGYPGVGILRRLRRPPATSHVDDQP